jgi:hypothetical protein
VIIIETFEVSTRAEASSAVLGQRLQRTQLPPPKFKEVKNSLED